MKTHCRCRSCRSRRVLRKHPDEYRNRRHCPRCAAENLNDGMACEQCGFGGMSTAPHCDNCGARDWRPDRWMNQRNNKRQTCHADCYHFPHRIGSAGCKFLTHGVYKQ